MFGCCVKQQRISFWHTPTQRVCLGQAYFLKASTNREKSAKEVGCQNHLGYYEDQSDNRSAKRLCNNTVGMRKKLILFMDEQEEKNR